MREMGSGAFSKLLHQGRAKRLLTPFCAEGKALGLVLFIGICLGASAIGGAFTAQSVGSWYQELIKPSANPPGWVFAPVWTALYTMMGIAAWLVWRQGSGQRRAPMVLFGAQLALNVLWSALFFGLRNPAAAFVEILVLFAFIVATAISFGRRSKAAALLFVPYILWVGFASYLNAALWRLND